MKPNRAPDFYMASTESLMIPEARACWQVARVGATNRDDLLVITVDPAIAGEPYGVDHPMDLIIVATRLEGDSLFPINTFPARPLPVYVVRLKIGDWRQKDILEDRDYELIAWAELYPSEREARAKQTYAQARKYGRTI